MSANKQKQPNKENKQKAETTLLTTESH